MGAGSEGGGEKAKGSGEGESRRLSRQHAKDISDYTKQILAKDRELDSLRKKLSKVSFLEYYITFGKIGRVVLLCLSVVVCCLALSSQASHGLYIYMYS